MTRSREWRCPNCKGHFETPLPVNAFGHICITARGHREIACEPVGVATPQPGPGQLDIFGGERT